MVRGKLAIAGALVAIATAAASPVAAQGWLFGQRRSEATGKVKVKGKYLADGAIRVDAHGGPFDGDAVARATLRQLAEMTRDKGMPRFAIRKEQCWQNVVNYVPSTNHCWAEAVMLGEDEVPPATKRNAPPMRVAEVLAPR